MNLNDLNSNLPKPWLTPQFDSMTCVNLNADIGNITDLAVSDLSGNIITLNNTMSVPNAPLNSTSLYSAGLGSLSQVNDVGTVVVYSTVPPAGVYVVGTAPSVVGNLSMFDTVNCDSIIDSNVSASNVFLSDGSVGMSGTFNANDNIVSNVTSVQIGASANGNVVIDDASSVVNGVNNVIIGNNGNDDGGGFESVLIGRGNVVCAGANDCNLVGKANVMGAGSDGVMMFGRDNNVVGLNADVMGYSNNAAGNNLVVIGAGNNVAANDVILIGYSNQSNANAGSCFGNGCNNAVANSLLVGDPAITDVYPNSAVCDLGFNQAFKNVYSTSCFMGSDQVQSSKYSTYDDVTLTNQAVAQDISTASSVGSLTFDPMALGAVIDIQFSFVVSSVAGDTVTFRYYANGGLLFSHPIVFPALTSNVPGNIHSLISVRNGVIQLNSIQTVSGVVSMITSAAIVYNRAIAQTYQITCECPASTVTNNQLVICSQFKN
jgi:hypothetical protein